MNTLTKKQFEQHIAAIVNEAVRPVSKGARAFVTVEPGRPHRVHVSIKAVVAHREGIVARLRSGRPLVEALLKVWPKNVFAVVSPGGEPRLLESGQVALDLQLAGIAVEG
jgi:hypothetical protein